MSTDRRDAVFRMSGIVGLAVLLGLVLWARQLRQSETHKHDHSDPTQHGYAVGGKALDEHEAGDLKPSGRIEDGVRDMKGRLLVPPVGEGLEQRADHRESRKYSRVIRFIGKFHPMAVHIPIALVIAAALAEILAMLTKREIFVNASRFSIVLAALGAVLATLLGISAGHAATYSGELAKSFLMHRWFGIATSLLIVIAAFISECTYHRQRAVLKNAYRVILAFCVLFVSVTAYCGGQLVHGLGHYSW